MAGLVSNQKSGTQSNRVKNNTSPVGLPGNQPGVGYPIFQPQRQSTTSEGEPILLPDGTIGYPGGKGNYGGKKVTRITIDCTNIFTNVAYAVQGSLVWFSGQNGGTAAAMYLTLCPSTAGTTQNDPIQFVYDRAVSGIPFSQLLISNPTAQPGVTVEFTIVLDEPKDRVGING
jgi:hypothetical protein